MGIKSLMPFVREVSPESVSQASLVHYSGCVLAIDASMHLYQFLIAIRQGAQATTLTNAAGEDTSHLQGFAMRCAKMLEAGVRPVFVFDGKPPDLKSRHTLGARADAKRAAAERYAELTDAAQTSGEPVERDVIRRAAGAAQQVTRKHNEDVKTLLRLMGVPVIEAPGEAEAQCAKMTIDGLAHATVTEDMDALTFGASRVRAHRFGSWVGAAERMTRRSSRTFSTPSRRGSLVPPSARRMRSILTSC